MSNELIYRAWQDGKMFHQDSNSVQGVLELFKKLYYDLPTENIMKNTGLVDNNGKNIFEGDIIEVVALMNDHNQKGATDTLIVKEFMGNMCLCFNGNETGQPIYPMSLTYTKTIKGNIFETPELLDS